MLASRVLMEWIVDIVLALQALEALQELKALELHSRSLARKDLSMRLVCGSQ